MGGEEAMLQHVAKYYRALVTSNGEAAAALFRDDGVIADGGGFHWVGREEIRTFIGRPRNIRLEVPLRIISAPDRLTLFGHIYVRKNDVDSEPLQPNGSVDWRKFRWVFHFTGSSIAHLCNAFIAQFPDMPATRPLSI